MITMAADTYTIFVPDRSLPITGFLRSMSTEEVRSALVGSGQTACENAEVVVSAGGSTLTFRRVTGGTKGA
jgi:uncharacterized membrane protein